MSNKKLSERSLKNILRLSFVLTAAIPLLVVGALTLLLLNRSITQQVAEKDLRLARSVAAEADDYLRTALTAVAQVAYVTDIVSPQSDGSLDSYLAKVLEDYPIFESFQIINSQGIVQTTAPIDMEYKGISVSGQPFFVATRNSGQPNLSKPFLSAQSGYPTITITQLTKDGMVVGYLSLARLSDICSRGMKGTGSWSAILDVTGTVVGHSDKQQVYQRTNVGNLDFWRQIQQRPEGNYQYMQDDERVLVSAARIPYNNWSVVIFQQEKLALASVHEFSKFLIYGLFVALVGALVLSIVSIKRMMHPLAQLTQGVQAVASGAYDHPIAGGRYREFMEIAEYFRIMTQAVQARESELFSKQRELQTSLQALEARNQELAQFAYIVSHDLKAPLRAIANLTQWIQEDHGATIIGEMKTKFDLIKSRVHRMESLIDGILQYSRVGRVFGTAETVITSELVAEVIQELAPPAGFTILASNNLPAVTAERVRLKQVFANLIGNAIKHHHRAAGRIEVTAEQTGDWYTFSVTDDGPGIAPEYHAKIFEIFQTLQPRDAMESTGVGLALVKKIVEEQGGETGVHSAIGQGATFYFTWPANQPSAESK